MGILVLNATTESIVVAMSGVAATTNPDFTSAYADDTGSSFTEGSNDGALNGTSSVTLVAAPAASTRRVVKNITICNRDTAAVTITVSLDNNGTLRNIAKVTLAVNDTWTLDGAYDATGALKQTLGTVNLATQVYGTLPVTNGGTGIISGTSGGVPYFSGATTIASSAALAASALVIGGGAGIAPSTTATGTGVITAIGNAVNTTGGLVTQSGTLTASALLIGGGSATAISSTTTGTGVLTALGVSVGSAGAFTTNNASNTFTAAQTFRAANAIRSEAASTQDAVVLAGRAGGTSSYAVTLTPTTLSANRTITLPDAAIDFTTGLNVAQGGTGRASSTAYAVICGGTTSTGAQQSIASVGTTGQVLTSNGAGALPTFQTAVSGAQDYIVQSYGIV